MKRNPKSPIIEMPDTNIEDMLDIDEIPSLEQFQPLPLEPRGLSQCDSSMQLGDFDYDPDVDYFTTASSKKMDTTRSSSLTEVDTIISLSKEEEKLASQREKIGHFQSRLGQAFTDLSIIKSIYDQHDSLPKRLEFKDFLSIVDCASKRLIFDTSRHKGDKNTQLCLLFKEDTKLTRTIGLFQDHYTNTALLLFLHSKWADGKKHKSLQRSGQNKTGTTCYAVIINPAGQIDFIELFFTTKMCTEDDINFSSVAGIINGHTLSTMFNSPYIIQTALVRYNSRKKLNKIGLPLAKIGLLAVKGLANLFELKHYAESLTGRDLMTIAYSLFKILAILEIGGIVHRDIPANLMLFKGKVFFAKLIDFDMARIRRNNKDRNYDLGQLGQILVDCVFKDALVDKLGEHSRIYMQAIYKIQALARALLISKEKEDYYITAAQALDQFLSYINPVRIEDEKLDQDLIYMQKELEALPPGVKLVDQDSKNHSKLCLSDAKKLLSSSTVLATKTPATVDSLLMDDFNPRLNFRKLSAEKKLVASESIKRTMNLFECGLTIDTDLGGGLRPLPLAIFHENWSLALAITDLCKQKKYQLPISDTVIRLTENPALTVSLFNLLIEAKEIDDTQRLSVISALFELGADVNSVSTLFGSPLASVYRQMKKHEGHVEFDEVKVLHSLIDLLYPEQIDLRYHAEFYPLLNVVAIKENSLLMTNLLTKLVTSEPIPFVVLVNIMVTAIAQNRLGQCRELLIRKKLIRSHEEYVLLLKSFKLNILHKDTALSTAAIRQQLEEKQILDFKAPIANKTLWEHVLIEKNWQWTLWVSEFILLGNLMPATTMLDAVLTNTKKLYPDRYPEDYFKLITQLLNNIDNTLYSQNFLLSAAKAARWDIVFNVLSIKMHTHILRNPHTLAEFMQLWVDSAGVSLHHGEIIEILLAEKIIDINYKLAGQSLLQPFVVNQDWEASKKLLEKNIAVNVKFSRKVRKKPVLASPFYWAIYDAKLDIVNLMCENKYDVNQVRKIKRKDKFVKELPYIFEAIKKSLPVGKNKKPRSDQTLRWDVVTCLLEYDNTLQFKKYKTKSNMQSKYMSALVCRLIEFDDAKSLETMIADRGFKPTLKIYDSGNNFFEQALFVKAWNTIRVFINHVDDISTMIADPVNLTRELIHSNERPLLEELKRKGLPDKSAEIAQLLVAEEKRRIALLPKPNVKKIIDDNDVKSFQEYFSQGRITVNEQINFNGGQLIQAIDYATRNKKWALVNVLLDNQASYNFTMFFYSSRGNSHCTFLNFIINQLKKSKLLLDTLEKILQHDDVDITAPSSSGKLPLTVFQATVKAPAFKADSQIIEKCARIQRRMEALALNRNYMRLPTLPEPLPVVLTSAVLDGNRAPLNYFTPLPMGSTISDDKMEFNPFFLSLASLNTNSHNPKRKSTDFPSSQNPQRIRGMGKDRLFPEIATQVDQGTKDPMLDSQQLELPKGPFSLG